MSKRKKKIAAVRNAARERELAERHEQRRLKEAEDERQRLEDAQKKEPARRREVRETLTYEEGVSLLFERKCLSCKSNTLLRRSTSKHTCPFCEIAWDIEDLEGLRTESDMGAAFVEDDEVPVHLPGRRFFQRD